jgi:HAD superfamily hydrolase (TIGR01484 family)
MPFVPLSQAVAADMFQDVRCVATDMDGTLTQQGKFSAAMLQALQDLAAAGVAVLIVTGRSAGWVSGLVSYLPVAGAIAENGGLFYPANQEVPVLLTPLENFAEHRRQLAQVFEQLKLSFPKIQESVDNRFRISDWTFDVAGLSLQEIEQLNLICRQLGWGFTYSSVQCHIKLDGQEKATALRQVLQKQFPELTPQQIVTVGDSPNDESLFNLKLFPLSVGVANVLEYAGRLAYQPAFITAGVEGKGFCELAQAILEVRGFRGSATHKS